MRFGEDKGKQMSPSNGFKAVRLDYCWEAPDSVQVSADTRASTGCMGFPEAGETPVAI